jgi:hypothetical protein
MSQTVDAILRENVFPGNTSTFSELKEYVARGHIIGFTGAGVSVPVFPTGGEREELKKIIATIRIKRDLRKDHPGERDVSKVVGKLEEQEYFDKVPRDVVPPTEAT